ncbi:MAG: RagB/SusD family nutrient uptake outer membrane protein, partial [Bacteroidales bacterium]|nr:RagB/SusD family nutrient uptake outer membrane protein [Bacteroidales bacterium]
MKKRLRMDVNCNPASTSGQRHYTPRLRFTEFFLNYAEAANEAWGPKGMGGNAYSAYDVIKAIRQRAGIDPDDQYLEECAANKDKMRELIRNERRIELCFES